MQDKSCFPKCLTNMTSASKTNLIEALESAPNLYGSRGLNLNQGIVGEWIVFDALSPTYSPKMTDDWFDSEKDGTISVDGTTETYEVKTVFPWFAKGGFPIAPNQIRKTTNVDNLYIVQVPCSNERFVNIWKVLDPSTWKPEYTKDGRTVCIYSFTNCEKQYRIDNEPLSGLLRSYNPTAQGFFYDENRYGSL